MEEGGGIDWESEMDRLLVMQMVIKMADINTPTKSFDLHRSWSKRITEEFYQQVMEWNQLMGEKKVEHDFIIVGIDLWGIVRSWMAHDP